MNETTQPSLPTDTKSNDETERTKQVTVAGYTAGVSAFFALCAIASSPSWPVAVGVSAVAAMVAIVCFFILKR